MKITGVVCSPRVGGNTEVMVRQALSGAASAGAEVDIIFIRDKHIQPCEGCLTCKTGYCHLRDDMDVIGEQLLASDGILIGVPTYWTIAGIGANFLDRTLPYLYSGKFANKVAAGIAVGARYGVDTIAGVLRRIFVWGHMHCVECISHYGTKPGDITENDYAMRQAWEIGRLMVLYFENGCSYPEEFTIPISEYTKKRKANER